MPNIGTIFPAEIAVLIAEDTVVGVFGDMGKNEGINVAAALQGIRRIFFGFPIKSGTIQSDANGLVAGAV